jgi:hypothetical protein
MDWLQREVLGWPLWIWLVAIMIAAAVIFMLILAQVA